MTENEIRMQALACADDWVGANEKEGSHKKIIDLYNTQAFPPRGYKVKYTDAWCAAFVSAIGIKMGISHILLPECGVGEMMAQYKRATFFKKPDHYTPKPGDLIVYDWDGNGSGNHIGIVEWVWGNNLTVLEGNYNNAVGRRQLKLGSKAILGYCVPDYRSLEGMVDSVKRVQLYLNIFYCAGLHTDGICGPKTKKALISALQTELKVTSDGIYGPQTEKAAGKIVLGRGCRGQLVLLLQLLLTCADHRLNADGIFGSKTEKALCSYQKKMGLVPDGLAGKNTFRKLCEK